MRGFTEGSSAKWFKIGLVAAAAVAALAFLAGYYIAGRSPRAVAPSPEAGSEAHADKHPEVTLWTCSMHPQIRLPKPGKCPICFMDLIPLDTSKQAQAGDAPRQYSMSEAARRLAEIQTVPVKRQRATVRVAMVGMVFEDETRVAALTARVDGRLDEVYVSFTGVKVNKGDPMVKIWSPTLIKSQVELFETKRGKDADDTVRKGAIEKLVQLGLTLDQVNDIIQKNETTPYVVLRAPINGTVMRKMAVLGQFVKEGGEMYIINDLSKVWVKLDAYETDMPWIRYGQDVKFTTPSVPGRVFSGKVLFIDPTLDIRTRSVKIRVEADNPDLSLKPGMFVSAELEAEVDSQGRVIRSEWAGKYICPVHPKDEAIPEPGLCPESKMPLRPAASFGYADSANPELPLVIPASAPLITGKRSIVYVEVPAAASPTYELREVVLGPRAGEQYVVYKGLSEGEKVVARGNFKIDSAMQILAQPSMMAPDDNPPRSAVDNKSEEEIERIPVNDEFLKQLSPVVKNYLALKDALSDEDSDKAESAARTLKAAIRSVKPGSINTKARKAWTTMSGRMVAALDTVKDKPDTARLRKAFGPLSESMVRALMAFRHVEAHPLYVYHCPSALGGEGAYWIEPSADFKNPYFGKTQKDGQDLLKCGELIETVASESHNHEGKDGRQDATKGGH